MRHDFGVLLVNALPEDVPGGAAGLEVVLGIKNGPELADFERLGGGAEVEGGIGLIPRGEGIVGPMTCLPCAIGVAGLGEKLRSRSGGDHGPAGQSPWHFTPGARFSLAPTGFSP